MLQSVLTRRIPPREGMRGLRQWAAVDFDSNPAYVSYNRAAPDEVELSPAAVHQALAGFLQDDTPALEMRDWALFIVLSAGFRSPETPGDDDDWYDPLWDAIHDMACPEVHGPITRENLRRYLDSFGRFNVGGGDRAV